MNILALETSTEACSIALDVDGVVTDVHVVEPRRHAELILPTVDQLLREAGAELRALDAIVWGRGPGSFTGVRIGAAVAQGLAYGANLPVVPISTLAVLAQGAFRRHGWRRVFVAQDARMNEVYAGAFVVNVDDHARALGTEQVCAPGAVTMPDGGHWGSTGSGWTVHGESLRARLGDALAGTPESDELPHALDLLALGRAAFAHGEGVGAAQVAPVYLRDQVTQPRAV
jgi:tRNA threonylcarbamoyladenosine biosynthesis protein TsaB